MFLPGPAAQPGAVPALVAAQEGLGPIFLSAPPKILENLKLHATNRKLPGVLIHERDELMVL